MKAQYVVSLNDDRTVSVDKVKAGNFPLDTTGLVDFFVVNEKLISASVDLGNSINQVA